MKIRRVKPALLGLLVLSAAALGAYHLHNQRIDDAAYPAASREARSSSPSSSMSSLVAGAGTADGDMNHVPQAHAALQELRLSATVVSENPAASRALILVQGGRGTNYAVGDHVTPSLLITDIRHDRVLLDDTSDQSEATLPLYIAYAPRNEPTERMTSPYHDANEKARAAGITYGDRPHEDSTVSRGRERNLEKLRARWRERQAERTSTPSSSREHATAGKADVETPLNQDLQADSDGKTTENESLGEPTPPFEENESR